MLKMYNNSSLCLGLNLAFDTRVFNRLFCGSFNTRKVFKLDAKDKVANALASFKSAFSAPKLAVAPIAA